MIVAHTGHRIQSDNCMQVFQGLEFMRIKDVMTTTIVKVSPENSVRHAARVMLDNHVSGLPVINDEGHLLGILSEGDLIRRPEVVSAASASLKDIGLSLETRANDYVRRNSWRVSDVMTPNAITIDENAPLSQAARMMNERSIKRIPVMREHKLVGIVSRADLLHAVLAAPTDKTVGGDKGIQRSIKTRLAENASLQGLGLSVTVVDGLVHLWGKVDSLECRRAARTVAEGVQGVTGVIDHFDQSKA